MPQTKSWALHQGGTAATTGGNFGISLLQLYQTEKGILDVEGTILTIIGEMSCTAADVVAASSVIRMGISIAVMDRANLTTPGGVPIPGLDSYPYMWLWQPQWHPQFNEVATDTFRPVTLHKDVHIRSMRKIRMNEALVLKIHNFAAGTVLVSHSFNILIGR